MADQKIKVITPDNLGKGITYNLETKKWEVKTGFDCESIDQLPTKPWKKGTTLLAKQDGECVKLAALDSIFQEIGVGIAADRTSAFSGETYHLTVTVTNSGESKNELTNLTVQKPLLGNYEILDVRTSKDGVDEVETLDQLNYNLKGLAKGGTFILRFSVKTNAVGTFQFSASVNPNSALDLNAVNNTDTIILKANSRIDTTYVPSVDCPRATATELDSNSELIALTPIERGNHYIFNSNFASGVNVFGNRTDLKGLRIRLDGVSTILVQKAGTTSSDLLVELSNGAVAYTSNPGSQYADANNDFEGADSEYTFIDGVLEFTSAFSSATIYCRPAGKNCRWQAFNVRGAKPTQNFELAASDVVGGKVTYSPLQYSTVQASANVNLIPNTLSYKQPTREINHGTGFGGTQAQITRKLVFTVKSGTVASFNFTKPVGWFYSLPETQGKTTITKNNVTVAADATSADSINSQYLQVIVED